MQDFSKYIEYDDNILNNSKHLKVLHLAYLNIENYCERFGDIKLKYDTKDGSSLFLDVPDRTLSILLSKITDCYFKQKMSESDIFEDLHFHVNGLHKNNAVTSEFFKKRFLNFTPILENEERQKEFKNFCNDLCNI